MGKDSGGNRKQGRSGAGAGVTAPQQAPTNSIGPSNSVGPAQALAAQKAMAEGNFKTAYALQHGVKLGMASATMQQGDQVSILPSNNAAYPFKLVNAAGQRVGSAKKASNLEDFAQAAGLILVQQGG